MGVPIRRLILATNENNVLEEFFTTGVYRPRSAEDTLVGDLDTHIMLPQDRDLENIQV